MLSPCLFKQSEEDIDVGALSKRQPENISNPMYESTTSVAPEPAYDPFVVSKHFSFLWDGITWGAERGWSTVCPPQKPFLAGVSDTKSKEKASFAN